MPDSFAVAFLQTVGKKRHKGHAQGAGGNGVEEKVRNFKGRKVRVGSDICTVIKTTVDDLGPHKTKD